MTYELKLNLTKTNIRTSVSSDIQTDVELFYILPCRIWLASLVSVCA